MKDNSKVLYQKDIEKIKKVSNFIGAYLHSTQQKHLYKNETFEELKNWTIPAELKEKIDIIWPEDSSKEKEISLILAYNILQAFNTLFEHNSYKVCIHYIDHKNFHLADLILDKNGTFGYCNPYSAKSQFLQYKEMNNYFYYCFYKALYVLLKTEFKHLPVIFYNFCKAKNQLKYVFTNGKGEFLIRKEKYKEYEIDKNYAEAFSYSLLKYTLVHDKIPKGFYAINVYKKKYNLKIKCLTNFNKPYYYKHFLLDN